MEGGYDWGQVPFLFVHNYSLEWKDLNGGKVKDDKSFQTNYFSYYKKVVIFFFLKIKQKSEFL